MEEKEEEFLNHYKNDPERHANTPSGVAGADLKLQAGGALRTPTLPQPGGGGESLIKDLNFRGKRTRCRVIPGRPALLVWGRKEEEEEEEEFFNHCNDLKRHARTLSGDATGGGGPRDRRGLSGRSCLGICNHGWEEEERVSLKILRSKPTRCRVYPLNGR